ncbi:MAG: GAF domain-containing protein [Spirochaetota bacterium]
MPDFDSDKLIRACRSLLPPANEAGAALQLVCDLLRDTVAHYDWVGLYFAVPEQRLLVLGPFSGAPTQHTQIPYGRGICGQSAETEKTFVIPDVNAEDNYLSCSVLTRAEYVEPIILDGSYIGQIDIDSHTPDPFSDADGRLLSGVATLIGPLVPQVFSP